MTATGDCSKVTAIILIQPVSYLQYRQAAHPANLSFWSSDQQVTLRSVRSISRCRFSFGPKLTTFPTSVPNSCNLVSP